MENEVTNNCLFSQKGKCVLEQQKTELIRGVRRATGENLSFNDALQKISSPGENRGLLTLRKSALGIIGSACANCELPELIKGKLSKNTNSPRR